MFVVSCNDNTTTPTAGGARSNGRSGGSNTALGACTTLSNLQSLTNDVFGAGSPDASSVLGKLSNLDKQLRQGNIEQAQSQAQNIVSFVQQKAAQGGLPGTPAQVQMLISSVLCYAGLSPDTWTAVAM